MQSTNAVLHAEVAEMTGNAESERKKLQEDLEEGKASTPSQKKNFD